MESYDTVVDSPIGPLGLKWHQEALLKLQFLHQEHYHSKQLDTPWVEAIHQYFNNPLEAQWEFPDPPGTAFQKKVWQALYNIPCGEVRTYGDLAKQIGGSPQAIGGACKRNPCPIIIPCHRVVAQNHLGGFMGQTQGEKYSIKAWLLKHEGLYLMSPCTMGHHHKDEV